jgi:hypothetical protein
MTAARDPRQATGAFDGFGYLCEIGRQRGGGATEEVWTVRARAESV